MTSETLMQRTAAAMLAFIAIVTAACAFDTWDAERPVTAIAFAIAAIAFAYAANTIATLEEIDQ